MLVSVLGDGQDREFEALDWDEDSGVFWINEGVGFVGGLVFHYGCLLDGGNGS
jgi:hypothetical protein